MSGAVDSKPARAAPYAAAIVAVSLIGAMAGSAIAPADAHNAALYGAMAASLGSTVAFAALLVGVRKGVQGLLAGFGVGFLARMITVAAGLVASGAKGSAALVYAACFFALYAATQAIEIAFVWSSSRGRGAARSGRATP